MGYILVIALYLFLIGLTLFSSGISLVVGLIGSVFVGIVSAVKGCIVGIHKSVTNIFMKVILYITIGIFCALMLTFVGFFAYGIVTSLI